MTSTMLVDMRSDTVTHPTARMKAAMVNADLGDDVFGDDPTVIELEKLCASMFGKPAGLFVPSGTMGNLLAVMTHCNERSSELIIGNKNHLVIYEQGGMATIGNIHPRQLRTETEAGRDTPIGGMSLAEIEDAMRPLDDHFPITRLVCLENSHNLCGGSALPVDYIDAVGRLCKKYNVKLHMDGARIFNAAAAVSEPVDRLCRACDSISVCLSKGLAAPVGSVLVGDVEFIRMARRTRKGLGGGMRQAGVLAACGIEALKNMTGRLGEDHKRAYTFASEVSVESCVGILRVLMGKLFTPPLSPHPNPFPPPCRTFSFPANNSLACHDSGRSCRPQSSAHKHRLLSGGCWGEGACARAGRAKHPNYSQG